MDLPKDSTSVESQSASQTKEVVLEPALLREYSQDTSEISGPILHSIRIAIDQCNCWLPRSQIDDFATMLYWTLNLTNSLKWIGYGSFSNVYESTEQLSNGNTRPVAIKIIVAETGRDLADFKRNTDNEATMMSTLKHPNIAAVYSVIRLKTGQVQLPFALILSMERIDYPLDKLIAKSKQDIKLHDLKPIVTQIGRAIVTMHHSRVVHRDIKPANIMVNVDSNATSDNVLASSNNSFKLIDFGLAQTCPVSANSQSFVQTNEFPYGTHHYLAPELKCIFANPLIGHYINPYHQDCYAFGLVLMTLVLDEEEVDYEINIGGDMGQFWREHFDSVCQPASGHDSPFRDANGNYTERAQSVVAAFNAIGDLVHKDPHKRRLVDDQFLALFEAL